MEIPLTIDDREVRNLFNRLPDRATDLIPSMQVIGSFYERPVLENRNGATGAGSNGTASSGTWSGANSTAA